MVQTLPPPPPLPPPRAAVHADRPEAGPCRGGNATVEAGRPEVGPDRGGDGAPAAAQGALPSPPFLPYVVAAVSLVVLGAVAWLLLAQPRRARLAIDEVIVLDGPASTPAPAPAPVAGGDQEPPTATDSPRQPSPPSAAAPAAAATPAAPAAPAPEPAPGDVLEAELTGEGSSGDGFVQIGGLTVYVAGGRKGERVRFRVLEVKTSRKGNRYARAERCAPAEGGVP